MSPETSRSETEQKSLDAQWVDRAISELESFEEKDQADKLIAIYEAKCALTSAYNQVSDL